MPKIHKISADWILPLSSPPIKNGILIFDGNGKILDLINPEKTKEIPNEVEKFDGILCPGFVNTHCHLELSWMKNKIPEKTGLGGFVVEVQKAKKTTDRSEIEKAIANADAQMRRNGVVAVGDISNTNYSFEVKAASNIYYHSFIEVYGSMPWMAEEKFGKAKSTFDILTKEFNLGGSITPHATYSVSEALLKLITQHAIKHHSILSIHHQESQDENLLFKNKTGWIVENMKKLGIDYSWFEPTGKPPLESIAHLLPKSNPLLLVHNTFSTEAEINFAQSNFDNVFWCLCPNANLYIEDHLPDIPLMERKNLKLTLGTDSLASNHQLSVLEEMKTICKNFPHIPLNKVLKWSSLNGAKFLGIDDRYGSFDKGKIPGINLISDISKDNPILSLNSKVLPIN
jgi:cytosine/adenosine deaminase-related metal-dependent hydrolase